MSAKDLVAVIIKLGGMALVVLSAINLSEFLPYLFDASNQYALVDIVSILVSRLVIPAGLGLIFLNFGGLITNHLIAGEQIDSGDNSYAQHLEQMGITILGVYLIFRTVSDAIAHAAYYYKLNEMVKSGELHGLTNIIPPDRFAAIVATGAEMLIALWLVLGARGLVAFFNRLRG